MRAASKAATLRSNSRRASSPVRLVLVGGFLGAGKTSLLRQAARRLTERGLRVGLITNDQAPDLVDTALLRQDGFQVEEVSGGCFCCRFSDLMSASKAILVRQRPDVLLCEPVGSCTDLAATVLRPLERLFSNRFQVAPYTVLVDPVRLKELLSKDSRSPLTEKVLYIYSKQLEEAEVIVLNKSDQTPRAVQAEFRALLSQRFGHSKTAAISAKSGAGVDAWLDLVMSSQAGARRFIQVDYEIYAEGEAELGWLNAALILRPKKKVLWKTVALGLLRELKDQFKIHSAEAAHVKLSLTAPGNALSGNLTSTRGRPFLLVQGTAKESGGKALLLLNARVQLDPQKLKQSVEAALDKVALMGLEVSIQQLAAFRPARPVPEHRDRPPESCPMDQTKICGVVRNMFRPKPKGVATR